ncbi:MAG: nucleotidyltransferase domain-containing protein [Planctomycetes bacterium]|nr:nucleotidyltransferase domain-containing protein [Planctomycetota bacterium]
MGEKDFQMEKTDVINIFHLNYPERSGLRDIIAELTNNYPIIKKAILYGSKARGNFLENSDIDLLLITEGNISMQMKHQIFDIVYKYELLNDIVVSVILVSEADFENKLNTLFMKIRKEGIILWSSE